MDNLQKVMQIIDKHSDSFAEGEYLEVCNLLKDAYNKRTDPVYLFDYDNFTIPPIGTSSLIFQYFYDYYFEKGLNMDSDFIQGQLEYLNREYEMAGPIRRITQKVRDKVERHCCSMHGFIPGESTLEEIGIDPLEFRKLCKIYVSIENDFRAKYRETVERRIRWLEDADDRLDTV
jgi:hypothetical protein